MITTTCLILWIPRTWSAGDVQVAAAAGASRPRGPARGGAGTGGRAEAPVVRPWHDVSSRTADSAAAPRRSRRPHQGVRDVTCQASAPFLTGGLRRPDVGPRGLTGPTGSWEPQASRCRADAGNRPRNVTTVAA